MSAPVTAKQLVDKLWSYCHVLRHDGVSTIDYVDQLTLLLFLKMADERAHRKLAAERIVPEGDDWQALLRAKGDDVEKEYNRILLELGKRQGTIGAHLPEVAEQDPKRSDAPQARRRPDQRAELVGH